MMQNYLSDKKNIPQIYSYIAKYILHNSSNIIININAKKKQERYNKEVLNAITKIVHESTNSFNNICYGINFLKKWVSFFN